MNLPRLWPGQEVGDPFLAMRREMENVFRAFDQKPSSTGIGAGAPAISVAETKDAFEGASSRSLKRPKLLNYRVGN